MNHLKVFNFGFIKLYIESIEAFTHIQNEKSNNLFMKNGFNIIENRKDNVTYQILYLKSENLSKFSNF